MVRIPIIMIGRESEQTSAGSFLARKPGQALKTRKQMTAVASVVQPSFAQTDALDNLFEKGNHMKWSHLEKQVKRLQERIAKATRGGRWNKVKVLQRLLSCSFAAKILAVKQVTENKGKRTPGVDGRIWSTPMSK